MIDAGRSSKRLDELSSARVIGKIALQVHAAQQKAGAGKAIGPIPPARIQLLPTGEAKLDATPSTAPGYSAPEQVAGEPGDRRSDVFSLGAVLWEALTHQRLFDAMNDAAVRAAVKERAIRPPAELNANIPAELSAICMRALARTPSERYQSLKAMAVEIEEFLEEAGYSDDDTKIAQFLADMRTPAASLADKPRPKSTSGAALAEALANAGTSSPAATAIGLTSAPREPAPPAATTSSSLPQATSTATAVGVPAAPVAEDWRDTPAAPPAALPSVVPSVPLQPTPATTPTSEQPPLVPMPPILPANASTSTRIDKSTIAVAVPPQVKVATHEAKEEASPQNDATHAAATPTTPTSADTTQVDAAAATMPAATATDKDTRPTLVDARPPEVVLSDEERAVVPATARAGAGSDAADASTPAQSDASPPRASERARSQSDAPASAPSARAASQSDGTPAAEASTATSAPNPVDAVSLPAPRDSKDVLAGWGWGTDKHDAIPEGYGDDDDIYEPSDSKKPLIYMIGAGIAVAALVTIIAFAAGGSERSEPATTANRAAPAHTTTPTDPVAEHEPPPSEPVAAESAPAPVEPAPSESAAGSDTEGSAAAIAATPEAADPEPPKALTAAVEPAKPAPEPAPTRAPAKAEPARKAKAEPAAKAAARSEPRARDKTAKAESAKGKVNVETAYRIGLQKFARGDTDGALASLRSSLAANPNHAPTWRGLGLVFEKMGEKSQARAAYKRYLKLAPSAGDAEIIRGRLERLGP